MLRHVIAPAHSYAQIPNAILRHPRLSPDAKALLNWQLSLPGDERQCLSATAERAGIGKTAFQRAKRQLLGEGYFHEWRMRMDGGRFRTVQLVSNAALSAKEALAVRDGLRPAPDGARLTAGAGEPVSPGAGSPTVGRPTGRAVGGQPLENTSENTIQPTSSAPSDDEEPPGSRAAAKALLRSLGHADARFAMSARTARAWAPLAEPWLDTGLTPEQVRHTLTQGLAGARSPLAVLRWRLEHALPDIEPPAPAGPKPEPRVPHMRECRTRHTQTRLFTPKPGSDEPLCPDCRGEGRPIPEADQPQQAEQAQPQRPGFEEYVAARPPRRPGRRGRRSRVRRVGVRAP